MPRFAFHTVLALAAALPVATAGAQPQPFASRGFPQLRLGAGAQGAFGLSPGRFSNVLVGVQVEGRFSPALTIGGHVAYANLPGKDGRVGLALPYGQIEYAIGAWAPDRTSVPIRFGAGYLPRNGPVLQLGAGLGRPFAGGIEVTLDAGPMLWLTHNQMLVSFNVGVQVTYGPKGRPGPGLPTPGAP